MRVERGGVGDSVGRCGAHRLVRPGVRARARAQTPFAAAHTRSHTHTHTHNCIVYTLPVTTTASSPNLYSLALSETPVFDDHSSLTICISTYLTATSATVELLMLMYLSTTTLVCICTGCKIDVVWMYAPNGQSLHSNCVKARSVFACVSRLRNNTHAHKTTCTTVLS